MNYEFIAVDIQNEFATKGGKFYTPKPSINFLKSMLFPFFKEHNIKINEIISDYRQPRQGDRGDGCHPGEWGYESVIPSELRKALWIKAMNSPVWVRDGIGNPDAKPGFPYPNPQEFGQWLDQNVGRPDAVTPVLLGLTIDCCVLSTAQELSWRGYYPLILREAVDHASGKVKDRDRTIDNPVSNWADPIDWVDLKNKLQQQAI